MNRLDINLAGKHFFLRYTNQKWLLITFLIWPFLGFILALQNFGSNFCRSIILAFFVVYGFTFVIDVNMDGQRYVEKLQVAANQNIEDVAQLISNLYGEHNSVDIVQPLITFIVSRFTSSHYLLFAAFAFVFGYFNIKSISAIYDHYLIAKSKNALIFMLALPCILPIFQINGFRMWAAAWVFFYGSYHVVYRGNKKYLWLVFASSLIHFSFLIACIILIIYLFSNAFVGKRTTLFMSMAIGTLFLSELPIEMFRDYGANLGGGLQDRLGYLNESHIEKVAKLREEDAWFMKISGPAVLYFLMAQLIIVYFYVKKNMVSDRFKRFFSFSLLFVSFANVASLVPSGGRFKTVLFIILVALLVIYYSQVYVSQKLNRFVLIGILPFSLYALIAFRIGSATLNTAIFLPSPLIFIFNNTGLSVSEWLF